MVEISHFWCLAIWFGNLIIKAEKAWHGVDLGKALVGGGTASLYKILKAKYNEGKFPKDLLRINYLFMGMIEWIS